MLEAALAILVVSISFTLILSSLSSSARATKTLENYLKGILLLEEKMSELEQAASLAGGLEDEKKNGPFEGDDSSFAWSFASSAVQETPVRIDEVRMDISWNEFTKPYVFSITAYFKRRPAGS